MPIRATRRSFLALVASAAFAPTAARAAGDTPTLVRIGIKDLAFTPKSARVAPGTTVVWTNDDDVVHTVTSGASADDDRWKTSPGIPPGATFSHTFAEAGTYPYYCKPHFYNENMHGTIEVR